MPHIDPYHLAEDLIMALDEGATAEKAAQDFGLEYDPKAKAALLPGLWLRDTVAGSPAYVSRGELTEFEHAVNHVRKGSYITLTTRTVWVEIRSWTQGIYRNAVGDADSIELREQHHWVPQHPDPPKCSGLLTHEWGPEEVLTLERAEELSQSLGTVPVQLGDRIQVCRNCGCVKVALQDGPGREGILYWDRRLDNTAKA